MNKGLPGTKILIMFPIKLGRLSAILYEKGNLGALGHKKQSNMLFLIAM